MSMYNMIFGRNPASGVLLAMLGLSENDVGRFRDAYVTDEGGEPAIAIYTRNGGGNREHWDDEREPGPECGCTGCTMTYRIPGMPGYLRDEDDDFDCTYNTAFFRPPTNEWRDLLAGMVRDGDPDSDWQDFLAALQDPPAEATSRPQKLAVQLLAGLRTSHETAHDTPDSAE